MASNSGENIRTLCRFRPLNSRELALQNQGTAHAMTFGDDGRSVWLGPDKGAGNYTLDAMLPPSATQEDTYAQISGIVNGVLQGYNGTIMAYGQARPWRAP